MRRHRTTAVLPPLSPASPPLRSATAASGNAGGAVPRLVFPLVAKTDLWDNYGDPRAERPSRRHRHGEPVARAGRRGRGRERQVLGVEPRRLHALPLRPQRHDVHVHPPEQRPDRAQRQQGRLREGRHVRRAERREGDGRPADRMERRLGRRERQPAPPLRGAPERRRRRQSVQAPEACGEAALRRAEGRRVQPRACAGGSSRPVRARRRSRSIACASTRAVAGSTSTRARWSSPSRSAPTSRRSTSSTGATLRALKKPIPVAAFTLKANATPGAIVGAPGELLLGRVAPTP